MPDLTDAMTLIGGALGTGGAGALLLKGYQTWVKHSQVVAGNFSEREAAKKDNFQTVVSNLEKQVDRLDDRVVHLEEANRKCEAAHRKCESDGLVRQRQIDALTSRLHNHQGIVLIEDSVSDSKVVVSILDEVAAEFDITTVRTLKAARKYAQTAKLIIADVILDDTGAKELNDFINEVPCPVIVHTGGPEKTFSGAAAVVDKWDVNKLVASVEAVIGPARAK